MKERMKERIKFIERKMMELGMRYGLKVYLYYSSLENLHVKFENVFAHLHKTFHITKDNLNYLYYIDDYLKKVEKELLETPGLITLKNAVLEYDVNSLYPTMLDTLGYGKKHEDALDAFSYTRLFKYDRGKSATIPVIEKVIFNDPATIIFWKDGTKTVVKAQDGEVFDPEKGLTMAISKKVLGNQGNYYNDIKMYLAMGGYEV